MLNFFYLGRMDKYHLIVPIDARGRGQGKASSLFIEKSNII